MIWYDSKNKWIISNMYVFIKIFPWYDDDIVIYIYIIIYFYQRFVFLFLNVFIFFFLILIWYGVLLKYIFF